MVEKCKGDKGLFVTVSLLKEKKEDNNKNNTYNKNFWGRGGEHLIVRSFPVSARLYICQE
jgi:hypothetical protein